MLIGNVIKDVASRNKVIGIVEWKKLPNLMIWTMFRWFRVVKILAVKVTPFLVFGTRKKHWKYFYVALIRDPTNQQRLE